MGWEAHKDMVLDKSIKNFALASKSLNLPIIVVTKYQAIVDFLIEKGVISADTEVCAFADSSCLTGKHVIGSLPLRVARRASAYTEIEMHVSKENRGKELSLEEIRKAVTKLTTYKIEEIRLQGKNN